MIKKGALLKIVHQNNMFSRINNEEKKFFNDNGFLILKSVLDLDEIKKLKFKSLEIYSENQKIFKSLRIKDEIINSIIELRYDNECGFYHFINFIKYDECFTHLLENKHVLGKIIGLLGWNIQLYHTHLNISKPVNTDKKIFNWHQDSDRINLDLINDMNPMLSLKVGFYLTDNIENNCGNLFVIPGSHKKTNLKLKSLNTLSNKAIPILARSGDVVLFDRRIWHSASVNTNQYDRIVLFYGYSYRWLKPRDNIMEFKTKSKIKKQLYGYSTNGNRGYTSPLLKDVPLKKIYEELYENNS